MGYGRGGTTYASKYFKYMGFLVGHEKVERDGICSFMFAYPYEHDCKELRTRGGQNSTRLAFEFDYNIHLLRDPWLILQSNMRGKRPFFQIIEQVIELDGVSWIEREMQSMTKWYWMTKEQSPCLTVKVEHLHFVLPDWLERNKIPFGYVGGPPSRLMNECNGQPYAPLGKPLKEIMEARADILEAFMKYSDDAGYGNPWMAR